MVILSACNGMSPTLPVINSFTADDTTIDEGESVNLGWSVTDASSVSISPEIGSVALSGSASVSPTDTTTYTLTATNSAGSSTKSITITVSTDDTTPASLPIIDSFTASSTSITEGDNVTLIWVTTGATTVYLKQQSESGVATGTVDLSGSETVSPSETTTYTLEAINSAGSTNYPITITVNPAAVIEQTITIQPGPEGKDSYISSENPDQNYGDNPFLSIECGPLAIVRPYLQFDLSDLPDGTVISSATLQLYRWGLAGGLNYYIGVYRLNGPWEENTLTWNTRCGYKDTPESTYLVSDDSHGFLSWDITNLVQGWLDGDSINYGICLRVVDEISSTQHGTAYYSSDETSNSLWCPKLEITYYVP